MYSGSISYRRQWWLRKLEEFSRIGIKRLIPYLKAHCVLFLRIEESITLSKSLSSSCATLSTKCRIQCVLCCQSVHFVERNCGIESGFQIHNGAFAINQFHSIVNQFAKGYRRNEEGRSASEFSARSHAYHLS